MAQERIDRLIQNSPYEEPARHWSYDRTTRLFDLVETRRQAGYVRSTPNMKGFDDPGVFIPIPLVNTIRERVRDWRTAGYPGATGVTRRLLEHWRDHDQREYPLFFCQLEAMDTFAWLVEAPPSERAGVDVPGDGGEWARACAKMATGTGKTVVMAMVVAWQVLNKVAYPQDTRFSKNILIVAPGLTVKSRLRVLIPSAAEGNYYDEFGIVPPGMQDQLHQGKVRIVNRHMLEWESPEQGAKRRSVDKRGARSDERYARDVLSELANARNLVVLNDEAHHAWRTPEGATFRGEDRKEAEEATKWVGGLDRIHRARGILRAFDFSATPFSPSGKTNAEESLFGWIVSDFGLNDAIESGLVKTPRVVVRDDAVPDAKTMRSRLYHIYSDDDVRDDLNRRGAKPEEPLPALVHNAYLLLGADWQKTYESWQEADRPTPPVMITVANRTETAARIEYAFSKGRLGLDLLGEAGHVLHIDSKVLAEAEEADEPTGATAPAGDDDTEPSDVADDDATSDEDARPLTRRERAEYLRRQVDTVGRRGASGEQIRNVISVGMLSEGWDARTVTHIMGLRAFESQLLCEQVVGRGLRRTSYDVDQEKGLFAPEYVNIFGVPFTFLPHEGGDEQPPPPPKPTTRIETLAERRHLAIEWPDVLRVEHVYGTRLSLDWEKVPALTLDAMNLVMAAEHAPILEGKPDLTRLSQIELEEIAGNLRLQTTIFQAAVTLYDQLSPGWSGGHDSLLGQVVQLVEAFFASDRIRFEPPLFGQDPLRRRVLLALHAHLAAQHIHQAIRSEASEGRRLVFGSERPVRSTSDMRPWYTSRPCGHTSRSHVNYCVADSGWELSEAFELDRHPGVQAWVKNDHLGFVINYLHAGVVRKFWPDYLVRLASSDTLVLEVKGRDTAQDRAKRAALSEWAQAVNEDGRFGQWRAAVSFHPKDVAQILTDANEGTAGGAAKDAHALEK